MYSNRFFLLNIHKRNHEYITDLKADWGGNIPWKIGEPWKRWMWNSLFSERLDYSNHWKPDKVDERECYQTYSSETFALWEMNCPGSLFPRNCISYSCKSNPEERGWYFLSNSWWQQYLSCQSQVSEFRPQLGFQNEKAHIIYQYQLVYTCDSALANNILILKWWHVIVYLHKSIFMVAFRGLDFYPSLLLS